MGKGVTRRAVLGGAIGAAAVRTGAGKLALRPKRILTLVRDAATQSVRAVEKVIWVAK